MSAQIYPLQAKLNGTLKNHYHRIHPNIIWKKGNKNLDNDETAFLFLSGNEFNPKRFDRITYEFKFDNKKIKSKKRSLIESIKTISLAVDSRQNYREIMGEEISQASLNKLRETKFVNEALDNAAALPDFPQLLLYRILRAEFGEPDDLVGWGLVGDEGGASFEITERAAYIFAPKSKGKITEHNWKDGAIVIYIVPSQVDIEIEAFSYSDDYSNILYEKFSDYLAKHITSNKHLFNESRDLNINNSNLIFIENQYSKQRELSKNCRIRAINSKEIKRDIYIRTSIFHSLCALESLANIIIAQIIQSSGHHSRIFDIMKRTEIQAKYIFISSRPEIFRTPPLPINGDLWPELERAFSFRNEYFHGSYPQQKDYFSVEEGDFHFLYVAGGSKGTKTDQNWGLNYETACRILGLLDRIEKTFLASANDKVSEVLSSSIKTGTAFGKNLYEKIIEETD